MSGEVPLGGSGEVPRGAIEEVLEGREDVDLERSTKASFGRVEVDLERSGVDFERSDDRVEVDFEPSNDSMVDFEKSAVEAGLVRAEVIVIEDEVLMEVATEYKLPEVLAVERMDEEGSRPPFVSPTGSAGSLGLGNAPKLGGGGSSSKGGGLLEAKACL